MKKILLLSVVWDGAHRSWGYDLVEEHKYDPRILHQIRNWVRRYNRYTVDCENDYAVRVVEA